MRTHVDPAPGTKQRLLDAAAKIFVEYGLRQAKIRDIVARARTNLAAVNYHFGGKEALYTAVVRHHAERAMAQHPTQLAPGFATLPPERALRVFVRGMLARLLDDDPDTLFPRLLAREMLDPTPALAGLAESFARPQAVALTRLVATLLGEDKPAHASELCAVSIVSQCMNLYFQRPVIGVLFPDIKIDKTAIDRLTDHICEFSLAGIRARARTLQKTAGHTQRASKRKRAR
ncbi:MAG: CerR family C-terminal domain-containing protein [Casimicrobiaceae bacterium]